MLWMCEDIPVLYFYLSLTITKTMTDLCYNLGEHAPNEIILVNPVKVKFSKGYLWHLIDAKKNRSPWIRIPSPVIVSQKTGLCSIVDPDMRMHMHKLMSFIYADENVQHDSEFVAQIDHTTHVFNENSSTRGTLLTVNDNHDLLVQSMVIEAKFLWQSFDETKRGIKFQVVQMKVKNPCSIKRSRMTCSNAVADKESGFFSPPRPTQQPHQPQQQQSPQHQPQQHDDRKDIHGRGGVPTHIFRKRHGMRRPRPTRSQPTYNRHPTHIHIHTHDEQEKDGRPLLINIIFVVGQN